MGTVQIAAVLVCAALLALQPLLPSAARADEPCVGDCDGNGHVTIDELVKAVNIALTVLPRSECPAIGQATIADLVKAVNNSLSGCGGATPTDTVAPSTNTPTPTATPSPTESAGAELGLRIFSIEALSQVGKDTRCQFKSTAGSIVGPTPNVVQGFSAGPIKLQAGAVGGDGKAPLSLAEDAIFGMKVLDGSLVCLKLLAAGSEGYVSCNEAPRPDLTLTEAAGKGVPPGTVVVSDGLPVTGAVLLQVTQLSAKLTPGNDFPACLTATWEPKQPRIYYTTGQATANKGTKTMTQVGESFSCANWTTENGPGMLVAPMTDYTETPIVIGDTANTLRLADGPAQ